jgi:hypothetical protein
MGMVRHSMVTKFLGFGNAKDHEVNFAVSGLTKTEVTTTRYLASGSSGTVSLANYKVSTGGPNKRGQLGVVFELLSMTTQTSQRWMNVIMMGASVTNLSQSLSKMGNCIQRNRGAIFFPQSTHQVFHVLSPASASIYYQFSIFSE